MINYVGVCVKSPTRDAPLELHHPMLQRIDYSKNLNNSLPRNLKINALNESKQSKTSIQKFLTFNTYQSHMGRHDKDNMLLRLLGNVNSLLNKPSFVHVPDFHIWNKRNMRQGRLPSRRKKRLLVF